MYMLPVKSKILTAMTMKSTLFWDVTPCSLVEVYSISENILLLSSKSKSIPCQMMELEYAHETSVDLYQTTCHCIPEDNSATPLP
jgi:hypothetical protein